MYHQATPTANKDSVSTVAKPVSVLAKSTDSYFWLCYDIGMLNPFNELLDFQAFAPILLRLAVSIFFIILGYQKYSTHKEHLALFLESIKINPSSLVVRILGGVEIVIGVLFLLGFVTQIAAIVGFIISFVSFVIAIRQPELKLRTPFEYAFVCAICVSLLFTGAGIFAVDLPL